MICQKCKQKEATTVVKLSVNGEKGIYQLCDGCARNLEFFSGVSGFFENSGFGNTFEQMIKSAFNISPPEQSVKTCHECGTEFSQIRASGRVGCSTCYDVFRAELTPTIRHMQKSIKHIGKHAGNESSMRMNMSHIDTEQIMSTETNMEESPFIIKINTLEEKLQTSLKTENYEEAAKIRDEIIALKQKGGERL